MNSNGKGFGLALIIILISAILVAYFAVTQMGSLGFGKTPETPTDQRNPV